MRSAQEETNRVVRPCGVRGNKPARVSKDFLAASRAATGVRCDKAFGSQEYDEDGILA